MKESPKTKARRLASLRRRSARAPRSERKRRLAFGSQERRGLRLDYAQSVKSSILSYYQTQNSSNVASLTRGKLCDQAEADARVAYYIATADADYAFDLAEVDAKEFALSSELDLLAIWSRYVINQNWTYDTIKYGGYDSLTYSMIEPNHTYNIATAPFYGGAVTTIPTATYSERNAYFDGIVSASNQIVALKNEADSEDASLATQNEATLAATKSANETARENAEEAADDAYAVTVENAWKNAYLAQLALGVTLKAAYEATSTTFNGALDAAAGAVSGGVTGATTGAAVGANVGGVSSARIGIGPGAMAVAYSGFISGAFAGGISGLLSAAFQDSNVSVPEVIKEVAVY